MYLHDKIKINLRQDQSAFDQLMALRGQCFRQQKGRLTQRVQVGDNYYFIKQHQGVGWREIFKNLLQLRWPILGAKQEKAAIEKLHSLGVNVPAIAAFGQRGFNPAQLQSFILMQALDETISLETLCKSWQTQTPNFSFKYRLIKEVARIAKTLHENGVNHRDFYICHFLLEHYPEIENNKQMAIKLYLIDLHRAQIRQTVKQRWIIKDLSGLYFSSKDIGLTQRDLYRFMRFYTMQSLREMGKSKKQFWHKVKTRGEKLYSQHASCE